ncbi:hypothetical protein HXZ88_04110 [Myroides odoratimimus]|uniref:hypothetical protein n=1 Tax=Myroides TaxID=76831 RepID=UPI00131EC88A|nr:MULTISPECIES: hypothetical protein [Myroides]MDM1064803.1 hypothetical protein [Myroides odoratimimus]MDM1400892.1 hypothetical protein [Myroides odoratimimus]MDM1443293.1 hypothetical protein [Myroides odoratimimus]
MQAKQYINNWFLENNPNATIHTNAVLSEIKEQLSHLGSKAQRIMLSEFLSSHYSNSLYNQVEEILLDNHPSLSQEWKNLGIFTSEVTTLVLNIEKDNYALDINLIEHYISTYCTDN